MFLYGLLGQPMRLQVWRFSIRLHASPRLLYPSSRSRSFAHPKANAWLLGWPEDGSLDTSLISRTDLGQATGHTISK